MNAVFSYTENHDSDKREKKNKHNSTRKGKVFMVMFMQCLKSVH